MCEREPVREIDVRVRERKCVCVREREETFVSPHSSASKTLVEQLAS